MLLTDMECEKAYEGLMRQTLRPQDKKTVLQFARAIESAVLEKLKAQEPEITGSERYRVEKTGHGFWPYCVRAGTGSRELFVGHQKQCTKVANALATAFEDGKFVATTPLPPDDVVRDAARYKWLRDETNEMSDIRVINSTWEHLDAAIDAAMRK